LSIPFGYSHTPIATRLLQKSHRGEKSSSRGWGTRHAAAAEKLCAPKTNCLPAL
jgi:hypothetical protein